jgi:hypothetical protein
MALQGFFAPSLMCRLCLFHFFFLKCHTGPQRLAYVAPLKVHAAVFPPPAKAVEKAAYAALSPASQQMVSALAENGEAPAAVIVGPNVILAEATALVPILGLSPAAAFMVARGGWVTTHRASDVA